jgi:sugar phosphate isomerase/epimerase
MFPSISRRRAFALSALCALAASTGSARAAEGLMLGLHDEAHYSALTGRGTFPTMSELGAEVIRVTLYWNAVAPARPLTPTDPGDPAYEWDRYDRVVTAAERYGIRVVLTIHGTPPWANGGRDWRYAPRRPSDLRAFAFAAGLRYSGYFQDGRRERLPRVDMWSAWNEPNLGGMLQPQWRRLAGRWIAVSPRIYARLCNAVSDGVHEAGAESAVEETVACGETAPRGNDRPLGRRPNVSPLRFLRLMSAAGARFDVYAHHAYAGRQPPWWRPSDTRWIALGNIDLLVRALTRLYGRDMRVWITEFGYKTNPPDGRWGVSWQRQAAYLEEAYWIARDRPRIDMLVWYQLRDDTSTTWGWTSGLLTAEGVEKPAYRTFANLAR